MDWEQIGILCQTELEKLEGSLPPLTDFFPSPENAAEAFLRYETETNTAVEVAVRQFAATNEWPSLSPIQKVMPIFCGNSLHLGLTLTNQIKGSVGWVG